MKVEYSAMSYHINW